MHILKTPYSLKHHDSNHSILSEVMGKLLLPNHVGDPTTLLLLFFGIALRLAAQCR